MKNVEGPSEEKKKSHFCNKINKKFCPYISKYFVMQSYFCITSTYIFLQTKFLSDFVAVFEFIEIIKI